MKINKRVLKKFLNLQDKEEFSKQIFYAFLSVIIVIGAQLTAYFLSRSYYDGPSSEIIANV